MPEQRYVSDVLRNLLHYAVEEPDGTLRCLCDRRLRAVEAAPPGDAEEMELSGCHRCTEKVGHQGRRRAGTVTVTEEMPPKREDN